LVNKQGSTIKNEALGVFGNPGDVDQSIRECLTICGGGKGNARACQEGECLQYAISEEKDERECNTGTEHG
jgi:hypothetical protein